ncbi:MAG: amidohydrolase family protein [Phycisphaerae bacterium]|nr:amidohydrolase family protein [Phycisphaerae bacterium]
MRRTNDISRANHPVARRRASVTRATAWTLFAVLFGSSGIVYAEGPTFLIKAGRVYTMAGGDAWCIDGGRILVKDGKIVSVGAEIVPPPFTEVIELPDSIIVPGLVSADSWLSRRHMGQESVGAQYRAVDAFDPYANLDRLLAGGVTTAYLNPGRHRLVSGVGGVVKLGARPGDSVLLEESDLVINLGEAAFDPPKKENWLIPPSSDLQIMPSEAQRPSSRLTQLLQLNESFEAALRYAADRQKPHANERPLFDASMEALAERVRAKSLLRIHADRAVDIEQAVAFCRNRKHAFLLTGAREASAVAGLLAEAGAPIVFELPVNPVSPGWDLGAGPDLLTENVRIPPELHSLPIAVVGPEGAPHGDLLLYASLARRSGLSDRKALASVTSDAARVLGVDGRVGSIQPGRDADFVVLAGEPLAANSQVRRVYVNGRIAFDADRVAEDRLIVRAGRVWTGDRWVEKGAVLIERGRVTAVGETTPVPPFSRIVDAGPNAVVTPGFIDARGHLGCEGDRSSAAADLSIARALFQALPEFERVCRAGVTTVLTSPYRPGGNGARVAAIHTAGDDRNALIVKETAGIMLSLRGQDSEAAVNRLRAALAAGRKYDEAWAKYEKELAEYKAKGAPASKETELEKKPDEVVTEKPPEDPVTGTWEGEVSGGPLPEPQQFVLKMKLTGEEVVGSIETIIGGGESVGVRGTLKDKHLSLEVEVEIPIGKAMVEVDIDRDDHFTGYLDVAGRFRFDVEGNRTEKTVPEIKVTRRRAKKSEGGPEAPKKDEALEPYRDLFASRIAIVIDVDTSRVIEAILPIFEKDFKVPFVLLNADGAIKVTEPIIKAGTGVILKTQLTELINRRESVQGVELSRAGVTVAFQSDAEDAARQIPLRAIYAIRKGMDPTVALRSLTGDPARLMRCDDVVGFLKPGCRGDVLIFDGSPLEPGTRLLRVFVDGKEVR